MLGVLVALLYLYLSAGVSVFQTWRDAKGDSAQVLSLERQNRALESQRNSLASNASIETQARLIGLAHPGEQTYVVKGLPGN